MTKLPNYFIICAKFCLIQPDYSFTQHLYIESGLPW